MLMWNTAALLLGGALDALLGDPPGWPHLVRLYGALIAALEKRLYPRKNKRLAGAALTAATVLFSLAVPGLALYLLRRVSPWLSLVLGSALCWQCLAARSLRDESELVAAPLARDDVETARKMVSRIVGRDTERLDAAGIARAAVETVAENTSDGVVAPLFYMALFGPVGGCVYKAINTMDSMIGYKNERYMDFGRCAARLDDAANFLPSRLSALLLIAGAYLTGMDGKGAARIWRRDRRKHESPNSAQAESAVAGALGVRLAGDAYYFGQRHKKPTIGDDRRPIEPEDIRRAHSLLLAAALEMYALALLCRIGVYFLFR